MSELVLSIDCGTQSLRTLIFDRNGSIRASAKREYEPYFSRNPGWAEQDPELLWNSLVGTCRELKENYPGEVAQICGVAVTSQRATFIIADEKGIPLRPAITWMDQRKAKNKARFGPGQRMALKTAGMYEPVRVLEREGKLNWIRQNELHLWEKAHKVLQVSGFLNFRLTGNFADSVASQIGHLPFDYRRLEWARPRDIKSMIYPVEKEKLCTLAAPGTVLGHITGEAARETGLSAGVPVFAAGSDKGCETIGTGCTSPRQASLSLGTTATVQTTSGFYCEPIRFLPAYPAPVPGMFNPEVQVFRGFWMLRWFRQEFGMREMEEAKKMEVAPEVLLNRLLREVPPGSMGLVLQPFWGPDPKNPEAKGAVIGFSDVHTRAHIYRAIIEGLGYALLDGLNQIQKATKTRVEKLMLAGGASTSDDICRIIASIFNLPAARGTSSEASALGAAMVAYVGMGVYSDFDEAIKAMVRHEKEFLPDPDHAYIYSQLYRRVYCKMYGSLRPVYREIRSITGYPEKI